MQQEQSSSSLTSDAATIRIQGTTEISLTVNGIRHALTLEPRVTLLDALREVLGLTGSKKGCDRGQCGACTVLVNNRRVFSCMTFAVMHAEDEIVTIEGLAKGGRIASNASGVSGLKPDFEGKTVGLPAQLQTFIAEEIAQAAPGAKVVEAFNTTFAEILQSDSRDFQRQQPSILFCGDDPVAKEVVATLIEDCGYDAVDVGTLQVARTLETLATVWVQMAAVSQTFPNVVIKVLQL